MSVDERAEAKRLAARLRETREYLDLSQQFVAEKTGIPRSEHAHHIRRPFGSGQNSFIRGEHPMAFPHQVSLHQVHSSSHKIALLGLVGLTGAARKLVGWAEDLNRGHHASSR